MTEPTQTPRAATRRPEAPTGPAQTGSPSNIEAMIRSRRGDSTTKRARVAATVEHLLAADTPITFAAVARHARVSSWLVYAPGVRDLIDQARTRQTSPGPGDRPVDTHSAGLRTDLALARAEITRLRGERDQQRQQLQLALGARLDNVSKTDLITRVDELTATNTDLAATTTRQRSDNQFLQQRVRDLEDDLAAARTSLRRMIRAENRPPEPAP